MIIQVKSPSYFPGIGDNPLFKGYTCIKCNKTNEAVLVLLSPPSVLTTLISSKTFHHLVDFATMCKECIANCNWICTSPFHSVFHSDLTSMLSIAEPFDFFVTYHLRSTCCKSPKCIQHFRDFWINLFNDKENYSYFEEKIIDLGFSYKSS